MYKKQDAHCTCFSTHFQPIFELNKNKMQYLYQFCLGFSVVTILYLLYKILTDICNQD